MGAKTGVAPKIRKLKLKHPELTASEIAKAVGCSVNNVYGVLQTFLGDKSDADLRQYQESQADVFDALSYRLLASVTPEKIANTKPMEAITGAAILIDKARLVRGQATGINVSILMDVVEAIRARPASAANPQTISADSVEP
jgi:hypothetical protein